MKTRTKEFDAIKESRKWKAAVARKTAHMSIEEHLAYFDPIEVEKRFQKALERAQQKTSKNL